MSEVFGPLRHAGEVEAATLELLRKWLPTYLEEIKRQHGVELAPPQSWGVVSEYDRFPEQGLPAVIIGASGLTGETSRDGGGFFDGDFALEVSVTLSAATGEKARLYAQLYAAAIRGVILQRRSLEREGMRVTKWLDEQYGDVPGDRRRRIVAAANVFEVQMQQLLTSQGGPAEPDPPHPETWPEIDEIELEVTHSDDE